MGKIEELVVFMIECISLPSIHLTVEAAQSHAIITSLNMFVIMKK